MFLPFDVKKLLKFSAISIGSVKVSLSAIMAHILLPFLLFQEHIISFIPCHIVF